MARHLVTGGAGFVGSHLVRHLLTNTDDHLVLPVTFRHRGSADRLWRSIDDLPDWARRITTVYHDLQAPFSSTELLRIGEIDTVFNLAAESHVDRSIEDPVPFIQNNVALALSTLELARSIQPRLFIQVSTDEVYGPAAPGVDHAEWSPIIPSNPYSASKAAQEAIATSYWRTYGVPLILTNTMNIIGEMQDREKFLPKTIRHLLHDEPVPVHVAPDGTPGSRYYLHARNQADALLFISRHVPAGQYPDVDRPARYHVVGEREIDNTEMVRLVAEIVGVDAEIEPVSFHSSRPGHDLRYALDGSKLAAAGWKQPLTLEQSLERTVRWTIGHPEWLG